MYINTEGKDNTLCTKHTTPTYNIDQRGIFR